MDKPKCCGELRRFCHIVAMAFLLCPVLTGFAAPADGAPDSGKIFRDTQSGERVIPEQPKPNIVTEDAKRAPKTADMGLTVKVESIVVTGQNIFTQSELAELLKDQLHKELTLGEFNQTAVARVTKYFHDHDYFLAQAYLPEQTLENGRVEIAVLVGRYGDIVLRNTSAIADRAIKQQLSGLIPGNYIKMRDLDRAFLLVGDLAGIATQVTLSPGKTLGFADIIVETKPARNKNNNITFTNWGDRYTGIHQGTLNYAFDNLAHSGDSLTTSILTTGSGLHADAASYCLPLSEGLNLNFGYSKVSYTLGDEYAWLKAHGTVSAGHLDTTWKVIRSRNADLNLQVGYNNSRMRDLVDTAGTASEKSTSSTTLGISGNSFDSLWGGGTNSYSLTGYRGSVNTRSNTAAPTSSKWEKVTYNLIRQQKLGERMAFQAAFSGQFASTNLDSSEKFSLGGANSVRAYANGEVSGDEGWLLINELQWTLQNKDTGVLKMIMFYDVGVATISKNPACTGENRKRLAGTGLGFSWNVPNDCTVRINYAWKACRTVASDSDNGRLWFQAIKYI